MEQNTAQIISMIADIQLEALHKIQNNKEEFKDDLLLSKLLQTKPEEISEAIEAHIRLYEDLKQVPDSIKLLNEYQTSLCSYILWRMESEWLIINQEGVLGAWAVIIDAQTKFHPEYRYIL